MLEVEIVESTSKSIPLLSLSFRTGGVVKFNAVLEGADSDRQTELLKKSKGEILTRTRRAIIQIKRNPWNYIRHFSNLESIHVSGATILEFPDLSILKKLRQVYIDRFTKPTLLRNLSTAKNLTELSVGTFSFNGPVIIDSFEEIVNCKKLEKLVLSYSMFKEIDLKRIVELKSLKELAIHQKVETSTLAYLAAKRPRLRSNELKAWQTVPNRTDQVKINGKRKPFLDLKKDRLRIEKYEQEFEKFKEMHAL